MSFDLGLLGDNTPERDSFSFSGMRSGWFSQQFNDDFGHFRYIGARDRLLRLQKEKGALRRMFETVAMRAKLTSLISIISEHVLGIKMPKGSEPNKRTNSLKKLRRGDAGRVQGFRVGEVLRGLRCG